MIAFDVSTNCDDLQSYTTNRQEVIQERSKLITINKYCDDEGSSVKRIRANLFCLMRNLFSCKVQVFQLEQFSLSHSDFVQSGKHME